MKRTRFLMIGGFLGAGKTTAVGRLARHYISAGQKVGLVTNDQAHDLVDTHSLRAQGFRVGEVPGACFCCKFDDLVETAARLAADERPDVIVTEPVGSCTDLVATVIEPLKHLHGDQYEVAPLVVLLKPEHGQRILDGDARGGFSPKAEYIFLKQIEEADVVVLNKIDKLAADQRKKLADLVRRRFPDKEIVAASSKTGEGFPQLIELLDRPRTSRPSMDVDYDTYAEGEAELGWLNATAWLESQDPATGRLPLDALVVDVVEEIAVGLGRTQAEPAHIKVLGTAGSDVAIANLVATGAEVELSVASEIQAARVELVINARVATDPELLADTVRQALGAVASRYASRCELTHIEQFRPGRPVPTHRMGP